MNKPLSNTFCILPWIHLHSWPNGNCYLCCIADPGNPNAIVGNLAKNTINEILNNDIMKKIRLDMLAGREIPNCQSCYNVELYKGQSWRNKLNHDFFKIIPEVLKNTKKDGTIVPKLKYVDFRFSNFCNLECKTCGSELSNGIASTPHKGYSDDEIKKMKEEKIYGRGNITSFIFSKNKFIKDELLEHMPTIEIFYFAGGEPLIQKEHFEILTYLNDNKIYNKELRYNTNLSTLSYKGNDLIDLWKNFKKIYITCSMDHFGEKLEYIRQNVKSEKLVENLDRLIENKISVSLSPVISIYNAYYLYDFVEFLEKNNYLDSLSEINWLNAFGDLNSITSLPKFAKKELLKKLKKDFSSDLFSKMYKNFPKSKNQMRSLILLIKDKDTSQVFDQFIDETEKNDQYYKTNINDVLPWLGYVIEKYKKKL